MSAIAWQLVRDGLIVSDGDAAFFCETCPPGCRVLAQSPSRADLIHQLLMLERAAALLISRGVTYDRAGRRQSSNN